jgi:hypothetical protein
MTRDLAVCPGSQPGLSCDSRASGIARAGSAVTAEHGEASQAAPAGWRRTIPPLRSSSGVRRRLAQHRGPCCRQLFLSRRRQSLCCRQPQSSPPEPVLPPAHRPACDYPSAAPACDDPSAAAPACDEYPSACDEYPSSSCESPTAPAPACCAYPSAPVCCAYPSVCVRAEAHRSSRRAEPLN